MAPLVLVDDPRVMMRQLIRAADAAQQQQAAATIQARRHGGRGVGNGGAGAKNHGHQIIAKYLQ